MTRTTGSLHLRNTPDRYGLVAQALHWLIVALVITQFVLGGMAADLPMGMERLQLLGRHKSIGMTVFMLMLLRLVWRLYSPPPPLPAHMPSLQRRLARVNHGLFYAVLLIMPIVGWIASSASNLSVSWFGLFVWPDLVGPDKGLAKTAKDVHSALAGLLAALIALHVAAALRHHWLLRDGVLLRMLPLGHLREKSE